MNPCPRCEGSEVHDRYDFCEACVTAVDAEENEPTPRQKQEHEYCRLLRLAEGAHDLVDVYRRECVPNDPRIAGCLRAKTQFLAQAEELKTLLNVPRFTKAEASRLQMFQSIARGAA